MRPGRSATDVRSGRRRARPASAARVSVRTLAQYRVLAFRERAERPHDRDQRRAGRLPVRGGPASVRHGSERRPSTPLILLAPGERCCTWTSAASPSASEPVDGHRVRLPPSAADRSDEARPRVHRSRTRDRRACARRAAGPGQPCGPDALGRRELPLRAALHRRPTAGRRAPEPRSRADDLPAERLPNRRGSHPPRAWRLRHERLGHRPRVITEESAGGGPARLQR